MATTTASRAEFARLQGWHRSYVTQLGQQGRLVLDDAGRVLIDATLKRIAATADPNRKDVADRHQSARQAAQDGRDVESQADSKPQDDTPTYAAARARKEQALADMAEMDRDKAAGRLLEADDVSRVVVAAAIQVRSSLESIPDRLSPELSAMNDQNQIHGLLVEAIEIILTELSRNLANLTPEHP